jgi:hypothetical protein
LERRRGRKTGGVKRKGKDKSKSAVREDKRRESVREKKRSRRAVDRGGEKRGSQRGDRRRVGQWTKNPYRYSLVSVKDWETGRESAEKGSGRLLETREDEDNGKSREESEDKKELEWLLR